MEQKRETPDNTRATSNIDNFRQKFINKPCIDCGSLVEVYKSDFTEEIRCPVCVQARAYKQQRKELFENKVPPGFRHMEFKNFKKISLNETAFDYAQKFRLCNKGLYLFGKPGVGKTHLMFASISELILTTTQTCKVLFFDDIIDTQNRNINKYDIVKDCVKYDYLYIDDVCSIGKKDEALDIMLLILQQRIRAGKKKTFMTSNISYENLGDVRITSRIGGMCDVVEVGGNDKRLEGYL